MIVIRGAFSLSSNLPLAPNAHKECRPHSSLCSPSLVSRRCIHTLRRNKASQTSWSQDSSPTLLLPYSICEDPVFRKLSVYQHIVSPGVNTMGDLLALDSWLSRHWICIRGLVYSRRFVCPDSPTVKIFLSNRTDCSYLSWFGHITFSGSEVLPCRKCRLQSTCCCAKSGLRLKAEWSDNLGSAL